MRKIVVTVSMVALFTLTACGQKEKEASCENVTDNLISLMAEHAKTDQEKEAVQAFKDQKADGIKECRAARPSAEALRCAANAKTIDEFGGCGLPMLN